MSHQPPVPEANQSPYPLREPPHQDGAMRREAVGARPPETARALSPGVVGTLAAVGVAALAAAGAWAWRARRKPSDRKARRKR